MEAHPSSLCFSLFPQYNFHFRGSWCTSGVLDFEKVKAVLLFVNPFDDAIRSNSLENKRRTSFDDVGKAPDCRPLMQTIQRFSLF